MFVAKTPLYPGSTSTSLELSLRVIQEAVSLNPQVCLLSKTNSQLFHGAVSFCFSDDNTTPWLSSGFLFLSWPKQNRTDRIEKNLRYNFPEMKIPNPGLDTQSFPSPRKFTVPVKETASLCGKVMCFQIQTKLVVS